MSTSGYSIRDEQGERILTVTGLEGNELDQRAAAVAKPIDGAAAAAGPGPVAAALAELRAVHDRVSRDNAALVDRAVLQTRVAIAAYVAADLEMERTYGPFPVPKPFEFDFPPPEPSVIDRLFPVPPR